MKILVVVASLAISGATHAAGEPSRAEQERQLQRTGKKLMADLRQAVVQRLNDPDSAKFRGEFLSWSDTASPVLSLCGELNAKNQFGGYTGFGGFIATSEGVIVLQHGRVGDAAFGNVWDVWCHQPVSRRPS